MAHELDTRANGAAAYFGRQSAWHTLGTVLDANLPLREVLVHAGLDFDVATVPLYTRHLTATADERTALTGEQQDAWDADGVDYVDEWHQAAENVGVMRLDRGELLGVVGSRYTVLQNRDGFGVLEPLLDAGVATIETAGALRGGRDVWMLVRFLIENDEVRESFANRDGTAGVVPYGLITNNHNGRRQVQLMETPIRVVCANTLSMAQHGFGNAKAAGRGFEVRHTVSVERRTTEAAMAMFSDLTTRYVAIARQYELLRRTHLDTETFRKLVLDVAAPMPEKLQKAGITAREETSRAQVEARRERLTALWTMGDGHVGDGSAWEAYNAVTQSVDHDADTWRTQGGTDGRLAAMFDGRLASVKQNTLDALVAHGAASAETEAWRASLVGGWK